MNSLSNASNVIALCALGLTCYNLWATRRHNRLSVTPFLSGHTNKLMTDAGLTFSYEVTNSGIGPAKIKKFTLLRHGEEFPKTTDKFVEYTDTLIRAHLGNQLAYNINHAFTFGEKTCLKPGETRKVAEIFFPGVNQSNQEDVLAKIEGMDLVIRYESFYGQEFIFDTRTGEKKPVVKLVPGKS